MKKFTEGKWEYNSYIPEGVSINGKEFIIFAGSPNSDEDGKDIALVKNEGDARLIAAAPEMYEAITRLVDGVRTAELLNGLQIAKVNPALIASAKNLLARIDGTEDENDEMKTFIDLVYTMCQAQKSYFKTRDKDVLIKSKAVEREVDSMLDKLVGRTSDYYNRRG